MSDLLYKIKIRLIDFFADIRLYKQPFFCILFGESYYQIKGNHQREIINTLKPGDVLLKRYDHYLGSLVIPGYWSHIGLYVGNDRIIHMLRKGIVNEDILTFLRADDIAILRCNDHRVIEEAIERGYKLLEKKKPYDYDFETDYGKRYYCTEMVSDCYGKLDFGKKKDEIIYPDDFLSSIFNVVWTKKD